MINKPAIQIEDNVLSIVEVNQLEHVGIYFTIIITFTESNAEFLFSK